MKVGADLLIGVDAGTSVIKAVAFDLAGRQVGSASVPNRYASGPDGSATQSLAETWADCTAALRGLGDKVQNLGARTAAVAVTGQGDGTWLVGKRDEPVGDAWLWLDARAAPTVDAAQFRSAQPRALRSDRNRPQHLPARKPARAHGSPFGELLDRAEVALHCKDWLYLKLTGYRATDPSEASFTFGNFRDRRYDNTVIEALGLSHRRALLPEIVDGTMVTHPLTAEAAAGDRPAGRHADQPRLCRHGHDRARRRRPWRRAWSHLFHHWLDRRPYAKRPGRSCKPEQRRHGICHCPAGAGPCRADADQYGHVAEYRLGAWFGG